MISLTRKTVVSLSRKAVVSLGRNTVINLPRKMVVNLGGFYKVSLPTDKKSEQITIPMTPKGSGIYEVTCRINDLKLNFIFDTGASDISISQTEAFFMLKNGYLNLNDIIGEQSYMDANGNIATGTKIMFREVDFGGLIIKNISASVVGNNKAPLLFGQSALSKYGKITIDNQKNTITISK